jgi:hypothetical protein
MKKITYILIPLLLAGFGCSSPEIEIKEAAPEIEEVAPEVEKLITEIEEVIPEIESVVEEIVNMALADTFTPDTMVLKGASNPGAKIDEDGNVLLLFEDRGVDIAGHNGIASASAESDWLAFEVIDENADIGAFRSVLLPDGTYMSYGSDTTKGTDKNEIATGLTSRSSTDGINFEDDEGYRYLLQPEDNGNIGVYEVFVDANDGVVLLYIGDKFEGENNVRRAYSTDGGWTFEFDRGNILGDLDDGSPGTYVDEKIISLGNGQWRLITMRSGSIYTFLSEDDGYSFELEGLALSPQDFAPEYDLMTLNDPQIIELPDGRFRIYVTGIETNPDPNAPDKVQHIFSATTSL